MVPTLTSEPISVDPTQRNALRRRIRCQRRALSPRERSLRSLRLAEHLLRLPAFRRSRHLAVYLPNDGEVDLHPLIERAWAMGKRCYLPVLSPLFHNRLWFAPYTADTPLTLNRFRIPEPDLNWRSMRPAMALDLVLAPLVAFDAEGNRLGMGGGFYDRTFAYLMRRRLWHKPRLVGIAYGFQQVEGQLPSASWDVPLDDIVTDTGLRRAAKSTRFQAGEKA